MSRQSVLRRWMPVVVLALLPLLHVLVVRAAPPDARLLGFTPSPSVEVPTTPVVTRVVVTETPTNGRCDPILDKQVDPSIAESGDLVTFTITVVNLGQAATVNGRVWDIVPDHLEILEVEALDEHKGTHVYPVSGQTVLVDTGIIGQDAELTVLIHTKALPIEVDSEDGETDADPSAPTQICAQNVAHFSADNCPNQRAEAAPCLLPTTGTLGSNRWWVLAAGLATSVLVLSLALSKKWRTRTSHRA